MKNTKTLTFGKDYDSHEVGDIVYLCADRKLKLDCGVEVSNFPVAYKTYGTLNADKSNAILICHALTGDQYLSETQPVTGKEGWWEHFVNDGGVIDTSKYFVICSNTLGGCMGSFGPKSPNPEDGKPYNLDFPMITISDMVKVQKELIDHFGITKLSALIGGSMGGMQTLQWLVEYPEYVNCAITLATSSKHSAQNIAFNEIGRQSIMADPDWAGGDYSAKKTFPFKGLATARMMAHITYLSEDGLQNKFGRKLQDKSTLSYGFDVDFQIESYLRYQGQSFVKRFDPNSYLYLTRAMDYFDLETEYDGLSNAFKNVNCPVCVISFSSDWLFTTKDSKQIVRGLISSGANVSYIDIESDKGHDGFLLPNKNLENSLKGFLDRNAEIS